MMVGEPGTEPTRDVCLALVGGAENLDEQTVYDLLVNERRRATVGVLLEEEGVTVSELASRIAAQEAAEPEVEDRYKSVYVSLQQTHLPKLDTTPVVEYDEDERVVRRGPELRRVVERTPHTRGGGEAADSTADGGGSWVDRHPRAPGRIGVVLLVTCAWASGLSFNQRSYLLALGLGVAALGVLAVSHTGWVRRWPVVRSLRGDS